MNKNIDIKNLKTAKRYASALTKNATNCIEEIEQDLKAVDEIVFKNEAFKTFFLHPNISLTDKKETLSQALEGKINPLSHNFIQVLLDENRFSIFETIFEVFKKEVDKIKNRCTVEVISAIELDENQKQRLQDKLNQKLNKQALITYNSDNSIIGGLVVKFEDKIIDLSLKTKFEKLKKQLI